MASLFNAVSINRDRFFFATQLDGEQQLTIDYPVLSGISTTLIGITGSQGNEVQINQMPVIVGTEFVEAGEGLALGGASTYFTPSTINSAFTGLSMSTDRIPGSGVACFESYGANGSVQGFEFLSRGVGGTVVPPSAGAGGFNSYLSTIGNPDATAVIQNEGRLTVPLVQSAVINSISNPEAQRDCFNIFDLSGVGPLNRWEFATLGIPSGANSGSDLAIFSYDDTVTTPSLAFSIKRSDNAVSIPFLSSVNAVPYPQNLLSTLFTGSQSNSVGSNTVTVLYTQSDVNTSNMIAGQNYLVDIPLSILELTPVGGTGAYMDIGVRLGGNGSFNYSQSLFISGSGLPTAGISIGLTQIADMGNANKDIDIVGYLHDATADFRIQANIGGDIGYMKMVT